MTQNFEHYHEAALEYLTETFHTYPESTEWEQVTDQLVAWMNLNNRSNECELAHAFAISLHLSNPKNSQKITDCLEGSKFWVAGTNSSCVTNPSLPILVAITLKDELQKNNHVSAEVKSFWEETTDQKTLEDTFDHLKSIQKLDTLWHLCLDTKNGSAISIVKSSDDISLYGSSAGTNYIDEYKWANDDEARLIAKKLVSNGSFSKNESTMEGKPIAYQSVYKIFYALDDSNVCSFIDNEIRKVNKEDWLKCFSDNGDMLDLAEEKNPHFSDALKEFLIDISSNESDKKISPDLTLKLPALLRKSADLDKTIIPKVINSYFSASDDFLGDDIFKEIRPFFEEHLSSVDEYLVMGRINLWIDNNTKERIKWISEQDIKPFDEPLEGLISRIELGLKSEDPEASEIAELINTKFSLGVVIEALTEKETAQPVE